MTSPLSGIITGLESWGETALAGGEKLLLGIAAKFTGDQFSAITDAATAFRDALTKGSSATDAWNAAYVVLGKDESAAIANAELGLADALIELLGTPPSLPAA